MKKKLFIAFVFISFVFNAQEEKKLSSKYDVDITYSLILQEQGKKKDKYILIVNATNNSKEDLYYSVKNEKDKNVLAMNSLMSGSYGFTKIKVRNSTGLFGDGKSIVGEKTNLITTNNNLLYLVKSGGIYTYETKFKVKKGVKPIVTNSFFKVLKTIDNFDLAISPTMLNGKYISSCGEVKIEIKAGSSAEKGDYLVQTTNGKQFIWLRSSSNTFVRENNKELTLTFHKSSNTYTYFSSDGISCTWIRK